MTNPCLVFAIAQGEGEQALESARALKDAGRVADCDLMILHSPHVDPEPVRQELEGLFDNLRVVATFDSEGRGYPWSANHLFKRATKELQEMAYPYWLYWDVTARPMRRGWFDMLRSEFLAARKPFMGAFVPTPVGPQSPGGVHLGAVAFYPRRVVDFAPTALVALTLPFEIQSQGEVLQRAHGTGLIHAHGMPESGVEIAVRFGAADRQLFPQEKKTEVAAPAPVAEQPFAPKEVPMPELPAFHPVHGAGSADMATPGTESETIQTPAPTNAPPMQTIESLVAQLGELATNGPSKRKVQNALKRAGIIMGKPIGGKKKEPLAKEPELAPAV